MMSANREDEWLMEAFAGIVLLVIAMFVYAGFTAVTEKLDEIIERLTPPRHAPVPSRTARAARHPTLPPTSTPAARSTRRPAPCRPHRQMSLTSTRLPA
jgi:hypothetical protein